MVISDELKCKLCGSTLTYIKLKDNQRVCRRCGCIEQLYFEDEEEEVEEDGYA